MALNNFKNLTGQRFGRLVVLCRAENKGKDTCWDCLCDCGNIVIVRGGNLHNGDSKSCGCLNSEMARQRILDRAKFKGNRDHPLGTRWLGMIQRCTNPNMKYYNYYGGRGISVCEKWHDFEVFLADVGELPGPEYTLERIDNDGNYEPGNVRWATRKEQCKNKRPKGGDARGQRNSRAKLTDEQVRYALSSYKNNEKTLAELADELEVTRQCVWLIAKGKNWAHIKLEE